MAASLEVRVPFLDLDLARFAYSLHGSHKIRGWEKKRPRVTLGPTGASPFA